ncbi:uncharacterized protein LOC119310070 [Triticum dicoccoides]|uniref:uncharacterized protein LOC119310070 n=1 Tax=Triticum dicoccoides TaxID=85692 RepID=UPI001891DCE0|nr:uncharacterized protein LOC119310070 [Triticum dicoccoides]
MTMWKMSFETNQDMEEKKDRPKLWRLRRAVRQQHGKLYIIRKCIAMLICGSPNHAGIYGNR